MKIDILGLQAFVAIADCGGFGKAANSLHLTQTAVTQRLHNLEDFLGIGLVERTTRSVELTRTGRELLPRARRLIEELAGALTEVRDTGRAERGDFSIACVPTAGVQYLPRILKQYAQRHPNNRIKILDHSAADVVNAVLRREAEFGLSIAGAKHPELNSVPLLKDRFVLVCRDDHALGKHVRITWSQARAHSLVFAGELSGNRMLLDLALGSRLPTQQSLFEVQRSSTAIGLVSEGIVAAVVPQMAMNKGTYPNIRVIAINEPVVSRTLVLLSRKNARLSPAAQALFDLIKKKAAR